MAELVDAPDLGFRVHLFIVFNDACIFKGCSYYVDRCAYMKVAQGPGGVSVVWCGQSGDALAQTDYFCNRRSGFFVFEQAWREA